VDVDDGAGGEDAVEEDGLSVAGEAAEGLLKEILMFLNPSITSMTSLEKRCVDEPPHKISKKHEKRLGRPRRRLQCAAHGTPRPHALAFAVG
jgi:hypothetical protein